MTKKTRHLGFWTLTFLVVANMVGAGVFTTSGFSLDALGSRWLVVLAWCVAGVIALAGAFSYGQLVKAMPESGGEYLFLSRAMHPLLGFIAGWVSMIAGFSGAIAFSASALEQYAVPDAVRPAWLPVGFVAVASIVMAGVFHGMHPRTGVMLQNVIVTLKLLLLAGIIAFATSKLSFHSPNVLEQNQFELTVWESVSAFAGSLIWISLSYSGFNAAVYLAGEVKGANRLIPRCLVAATLLVIVLYVLLNAVFVFANNPKDIVGKSDIAAITARSLGGLVFDAFVRWTIVACLLTSVLSMMMSAPRVYAKMADDGLLPGFLRFDVNIGDGPRIATLVQVVLAALLVMTTTLQDLLSYLGLTLSLCAALSVGCLFLPNVRSRPLWHPIHWPPAFFITGTILSAIMLTVSNPWQVAGTLVTFAIGAVAYVMVRGDGSRS